MKHVLSLVFREVLGACVYRYSTHKDGTLVVLKLSSAGLHHLVVHRHFRVLQTEFGEHLEVDPTYTHQHSSYLEKTTISCKDNLDLLSPRFPNDMYCICWYLRLQCFPEWIQTTTAHERSRLPQQIISHFNQRVCLYELRAAKLQFTAY